MLAEALYDFRNVLRARGVIFCYSGYMTETVLSGVGEALKQKMVIEEADTKTIRSVFAVFVEQMQNMIKYSAEKVEEHDEGGRQLAIRFGVISIAQEDGAFTVEAGNKIMKNDVERMRSWLDRIRSSDKEQLKAMYKERLREPPEATSMGAGVGFIEIARRASKPIEFDFMNLEDEYAFFAIKAQI
jgi:hypothetical protein